MWFCLHLYCFHVCCYRFSIDRATDQDMIFHIDPDSGAITLGKILDRETAGWHNITVKAVEAGTLNWFSFRTHRLTFISAFQQSRLICFSDVHQQICAGTISAKIQCFCFFSDCQNGSKQCWKSNRTILTSLMFSLLLLLLTNLFQMSLLCSHFISKLQWGKASEQTSALLKSKYEEFIFFFIISSSLPLQRKRTL